MSNFSSFSAPKSFKIITLPYVIINDLFKVLHKIIPKKMSLLNFDSRFSDNKSFFNTDKPSNVPISMLFTLFDDKSITVRDFCERKEPCCKLSVNVKYYY